MRAYFFGNFYLSSIQQGIQAQHCTSEMLLKYLVDEDGPRPDSRQEMLGDWAREHKTSILLNGGDCAELFRTRELMYDDSNPYPWTYFRESEGALERAITCVGIILPEKMYSDEAKSYVRSESRRELGTVIGYSYEVPELTPWEFQLIQHISKCGLAR
jgi:hypothetical protein